MLKSDSIKAGHAYVNERAGSIREVVEELDRLRVMFNEFDLQTGHLIPAPFQIAYKSQLARWAEREARTFESARLHTIMGLQWFQALRPSELKKAELERTRASVEQVVGNNTLHRW
jgi:hypothetical protein